ncbi:MAG: hypothetical protein AB7U38_04390 [Hyphomicrobiales bacterium]
MTELAGISPWRSALLALSMIMCLIAPSPSHAGDKQISVELNRVTPGDGACRVSLVFTNHLDVPVESLAMETVLFDKQGSVERFVVLKSRPLTPGKIRVQQFDMRGLQCDGIGKFLLNDVTECKAGDLTAAACLEQIAVTSRTDIPFVSTAASN